VKRPRIHQLSRRSLQVLVLFLTVLTPVLARYTNYLSARQLDKVGARFEGSVQGLALRAVDLTLAAATDVERPPGERRKAEVDRLLVAARGVRGSTWSLELAGWTLTDPLAALESIAASRSVRWVLVAGVLLPVLGTLLLGRVFCSWICPAGFLLELSGKLRGVLRALELKPGRVRLWHGNKVLILAVGLAASFAVGLPLLGYLYPPALVGREAHNGITVLFDRAEEGLLGFSAAGLTLASWFLLAIALMELAFGPRLWCRSLCPGGAVYTLLGRRRALNVERAPESCTRCGSCVLACEMGLSPMTDQIGGECDNCGKCVAECPDDALHYVLGRRKTRLEVPS